MPIKSDDPLRKVTLNLYEEDCIGAEKLYGHGWSAELRRVWHEHIYSRSSKGFDMATFQKQRFGDLE